MDVDQAIRKLKILHELICVEVPEDKKNACYRKMMATIASEDSWFDSQCSFVTVEHAIQNCESELRNVGSNVGQFHKALRHLHAPEFGRGMEGLEENLPRLFTFFAKLSELRSNSGDYTPTHLTLEAGHSSQHYPSMSRVDHSRRGGGDASSVSRSNSSEFNRIVPRPQTLMTRATSSNSIPTVFRSSNQQTSSSRPTALPLPKTPSDRTHHSINYYSEETVIKELLMCFQGVPGTIFKLDHQQGFTLDPTIKIPHEIMALKLAELGYLHNRLVNTLKQLEKRGAVAQAVHFSVKQFLTEYYGFVGRQHTHFFQTSVEVDTPMSVGSNSPSVFELYVSCQQPMKTLKLLCDVVKFALAAQGGACLSSIETIRHHGNPDIRDIMTIIVKQAGSPIVRMITSWMIHGTLYDPLDDFFISIVSNCQKRDIWKDKFVLKPSMIPSLISDDQAEMILRTGKGIHFLNAIRGIRLPVEGKRAEFRKMEDASIIDFSSPRSELSRILCAVSEETSKLVLDILKEEFKLFQHFQGMRRYILLGQGDFASYFLELIEPEMRKPAQLLRYHELIGLLGTAIRGCTASHEDPEVLKRITVKILEASEGDKVSDVFTLQYVVPEPLDAAFNLSGGAYSHMFNFLWRTKRMEHVLLGLKKDRWTHKKELVWIGARIQEVNSLLKTADNLVQEFLHFARQFHYYILFEVVECLWETFCENFRKAQSFDEVIKAHDEFIFEMQKKTFQIGDESKTFINDLRLIWDLVFELESLQQRFIDRVSLECSHLLQLNFGDEQQRIQNKEAEEFGHKNKELKNFLASIKAQYNIINRNYQEILKKFLLELSTSRDHELRLLLGRIDFNENYKRTDAQLTDSMKYSRCSAGTFSSL